MALGSFSGEVGFCRGDRATALDTRNSFSCFRCARPCHPNLCLWSVMRFAPHSGGSVVTPLPPAPRPAPRRVSPCSGCPACRTESAVGPGRVRIPRARDQGRIHLRRTPRGPAAGSWKTSNRACLGNEGQGRPRPHVGGVAGRAGRSVSRLLPRQMPALHPSRPCCVRLTRPSHELPFLEDAPWPGHRARPSACAISFSTLALVSQTSCGGHAQSHTHAVKSQSQD